MIVISGALVLVALVLLVLGLVGDTLALVYASIGVTVLAGILLGAAVLKNRREALPGDAPSDDLLPGGLHDDATQHDTQHDAPRRVADAGQPPSPSAGATPSPALAPEAAGTSSWDEEADRPGGGEVLVVPGRARYHVEGCRYLTDQVAEAIDVLDAREDGFTACGVCRPDDALGIEPVLVRTTGAFSGTDAGEDEDLEAEDELEDDQDLQADELASEPDLEHDDDLRADDLGADDLGPEEDLDSEPVAEQVRRDEPREPGAGEPSRVAPFAAERLAAEPQDEVAVAAGSAEQDVEPSSGLMSSPPAPEHPGPVQAPTTTAEVTGPPVALPSPDDPTAAAPAQPDATAPTGDDEVGSRRITGAAPARLSSEASAPAVTTDADLVVPDESPATVEGSESGTAAAPSPTGRTSTPKTTAAKAVAPRTTASKKTAPRTASPRTTAAKAVAQTTGVPQTGASGSVTRRAAAPKPATPATTTPQVTADRPTPPRRVAAKPPTTRSAAPASAGPGPVSAGTSAPRPTSAQPPANRAALAKAAASRAALAKSTAPKPAEGRASAARPSPATGTDPVPGQTSSSGLPVRPPSAAARAVTARAVAARTVASRAAAARAAARPEPASDAPPAGRSTGASTGSTPPAGTSPAARPGGTGSRKVSAKAPGRPVVPPLDLSSPRPATAPRPTQGAADQAGVGSVVVIPDRDRFHRTDCRYVRGQAGARSLSRDSAAQQGFQPCGVCQP